MKINSKTKYFIVFIASIFLVGGLNFFTSIEVVYAAPPPCTATGNEYCLLEPIPLNDNNVVQNKISIATYIPQMIRLSIALAGAMAVIMLIFAGFQYISSEGFGKKSDAKEKIQNALLGLLLVIGSYSILYTINPELLVLDLNIAPVPGGEGLVTETPGLPPPPPPDPDPNEENKLTGDPWYADSSERQRVYELDMSVNKQNCPKIGSTNCTSVYGIGSTVLNGLGALRQACRANNCIVQITGGTEYWLHSEGTSHRPGGNVVDLGRDTNLLNFLKANGTRVTTPGCSTGIKYEYKGAIYVDEVIAGNPPHFHVCF